MKRTGFLCGAAGVALLIVGACWLLLRPVAEGKAAPAPEKAAAKTGRAMVWLSGEARKVEFAKGETTVTVQAGRFFRGGETERHVWVRPFVTRKGPAEVWMSRDDVTSLLAWYGKAKDVKPSKKKVVVTSGSVWTCMPSVPFGFRNPGVPQWDVVTVTMEFGSDAMMSFSRTENHADTFSATLSQAFFDALAEAGKDLGKLDEVQSPLDVK